MPRKNLTPAQQIKKARRPKKVETTINLAAANPAIMRDWKTLKILIDMARRDVTRRRQSPAPKSRPALYRRYRGTGFPLTEIDGKPLLPWRYRTQWFKAQMASLCLHAGHVKPFTLHLHEQLVEELRAQQVDLKVYLRNEMARQLKKRFARVPRFMFAIENLSQTGASRTRVHVHGEIEIIPKEPRRRVDGSFTLNSRMRIMRFGLDAVCIEVGEDITEDALRAASGNDGSRPKAHKGRSQSRNLWWRKPLFPFSNEEWVSYLFKNAHRESRVLSDNRFCMSRDLNQEAQRLWNLVAKGEATIDQWE